VSEFVHSFVPRRGVLLKLARTLPSAYKTGLIESIQIDWFHVRSQANSAELRAVVVCTWVPVLAAYRKETIWSAVSRRIVRSPNSWVWSCRWGEPAKKWGRKTVLDTGGSDSAYREPRHRGPGISTGDVLARRRTRCPCLARRAAGGGGPIGPPCLGTVLWPHPSRAKAP
jgi:hypothetical protein